MIRTQKISNSWQLKVWKAQLTAIKTKTHLTSAEKIPMQANL